MSSTINEAIGQRNFRNNQLKATINLLYTFNWFRDKQNLIFKEYGILMQHFNVMKIVKGRHPDTICPGEVLEVMLDKKRDLTRLVNKLVDSGYLHRAYDQNNRRKVNLSISEKGIKLITEIENKLDILVDNMNNLTEDEAQHLSNLLDKMRG